MPPAAKPVSARFWRRGPLRKWGLQVGGGAEVAPGVALIGTGTVGRRVGFRLAVAAGWK